MGEEAGEAGRRARPSQARSHATLERILEAARQVLVDKGVQGFNTNAVADEADVNVGTLYHYFADKNAVLRELLERDEVARVADLTDVAARLEATADLGAWARHVVRTTSLTRASTTADLAVRRACRAIPELAVAAAAADLAGVRLLAPAVRQRYPFLSAKRATTVAWMLVDVVCGGLDRAGEHPHEAAALRRELETMLTNYLEAYERQR